MGHTRQQLANHEEYMTSSFQHNAPREEPDAMLDWAEAYFSSGTASRADFLRRLFDSP